MPRMSRGRSRPRRGDTIDSVTRRSQRTDSGSPSRCSALSNRALRVSTSASRESPRSMAQMPRSVPATRTHPRSVAGHGEADQHPLPAGPIPCGRHAEVLPGVRVEAATRSEPGVIERPRHGHPGAQPVLQPSRAERRGVPLRRDPDGPLEDPVEMGRAQAHRLRQLREGRRPFRRSDQTADADDPVEVRLGSHGDVRPATAARPEARRVRLRCGRKEEHVASPRQARRAGGAAEYPGRLHPVIERPVGASVATDQRHPFFLLRRHDLSLPCADDPPRALRHLATSRGRPVRSHGRSRRYPFSLGETTCAIRFLLCNSRGDAGREDSLPSPGRDSGYCTLSIKEFPGMWVLIRNTTRCWEHPSGLFHFPDLRCDGHDLPNVSGVFRPP